MAGAPSLYKEQYCDQLIIHMSQGFSFDTFAALISVSGDTLYEWAKVHPKFSEAKRIGRQKEVLFWESLLRGGASGKIKNYNATSVIFALKNKAPRIWRDKIEIDATINEGQTKEKLQALLKNPEYRDAALKIAEGMSTRLLDNTLEDEDT